MALIRWEPVRELNSLQHEMNRLFNTFFETPGRSGLGNGGLHRWVPPMDLVETEDAFVLRADLPGLAEDDVTIELEDTVLTLSGEREAEHEAQESGFYRLERPHGQFSRSLTLPKGVNGELITASFNNGVLDVRIPKPEESKPRKVTIGVGSSGQAIEGRETEAN